MTSIEAVDYKKLEEEARQKARELLRKRLMFAAWVNGVNPIEMTGEEIDLLLTAIGIHERLT